MARFLNRSFLGICTLVFCIFYNLQLSAATSEPLQHGPLTFGQEADINEYREDGFKISEINVRDVGPDHISATLFRIISIQAASSQSRFPFLRSPESVAKLQKLIAKGVPVLITPFYESYGAMVLFPKTEPHNLLLQRLHLPNGDPNPILFLQVNVDDDVIVYELVHIEQAYSDYGGALNSEAEKIFRNRGVSWENETPEHQEQISAALDLMREIPAYDKQIEFLRKKSISSGHPRADFSPELAGIQLQFGRLNHTLEAEQDTQFKNCICEMFKAREAKFKNIPFMQTMKACKE